MRRTSNIHKIVTEEINSFVNSNQIVNESNFGRLATALGKTFAPNLTNNLEGLGNIFGSFRRMNTPQGKRYLQIKNGYEQRLQAINKNINLRPKEREQALANLKAKYGASYEEAMKYLYPNGKNYGNGRTNYSASYGNKDALMRQQILAWDGSYDIQRFLVDNRLSSKEADYAKNFFNWCKQNRQKVDIQSYNEWLRAWAG